MTDGPTPTAIETDVVTPPDRRFWLDDEMFDLDDKGMHVPRFSVQEASKSFFAEGSDWLRWRMRPDKPGRKRCRKCNATGRVAGKKCKSCDGTGLVITPPNHPHGFFVIDGKPLEFKRLKVPSSATKAQDPNAVTARYYTLADIEKMAHALHEQGIITEEKLANIVAMARSCATLYGVKGVELISVPEPIDEETVEPEDEE